VEVRPGGGPVTVEGRDTGQWRDARGTHRRRGLTLMRGLMDSVDVERQDEGTVVRLIRSLGVKAA